MDKITDLTQLDTWKEAHKLSIDVYKLLDNFPKKEQFVLTSQMARAVISVPSNVAEGFGRRNLAEKYRFYQIAAGSLSELYSQVMIANDLRYISQQEFDQINEQIIIVRKLLTKLSQSTDEKKKKMKGF